MDKEVRHHRDATVQAQLTEGLFQRQLLKASDPGIGSLERVKAWGQASVDQNARGVGNMI